MKRPNRITNLEAFHLGIELVKKAGFVLSHVSNQTETCYYWHPALGKKRLLRVSTHSSRKSPIGLNGVASRLTFTEKDTTPKNEAFVVSHVTWAIGQYFLFEPRVSKYKGKRGTWEVVDTTIDIALANELLDA